jgi:hypothetical protein
MRKGRIRKQQQQQVQEQEGNSSNCSHHNKQKREENRSPQHKLLPSYLFQEHLREQKSYVDII